MPAPFHPHQLKKIVGIQRLVQYAIHGGTYSMYSTCTCTQCACTLAQFLITHILVSTDPNVTTVHIVCAIIP